MSDTLTSPTNFRSGFVAIVGAANAGKSTLLNALLRAKISIVSKKPHTTRNRIAGIKTTPEYQIIFVDTPGFAERRSTGELSRFVSSALAEAASEGDAVLLVLDGHELARRPEGLGALPQELSERGIPRVDVVAINKIDAIPHEGLLPLLQRLGEIFPAETDLVPISALRKDGLDILEKVLIGRIPEGPQLFPPDTITDQSEAFLAAEIVREKLITFLNQELPYSVAVRTEGWEEEDALLRIHAAILVERDSQKAIVVGKGGQKIKQVGQAARLELEKIFGTHVYLNLFVRVEENWTRSKGGLLKAGYSKLDPV